MYEVNRSLVLLKPRQPFADWLLALPGQQADVTLDALRDSANALLIPVAEDLDEIATLLAERMDDLFEAELADWCDDQTLWPTPRTLDVFRAWFDVEIHPVVTDLADAPLAREAFRPFES